MTKSDIEAVLKKHTYSQNSFVDNDGKNHWYDIVDEIYNLAATQRTNDQKAHNDSSRNQEATHKHFIDGKGITIAGTKAACKNTQCLVVTHQHNAEGVNEVVNKEGSVDDCTEYCKKMYIHTLDAEEGVWKPDKKASEEVPDDHINDPARVSNAFVRDCIFTRDMMRTVHTRLTGKILTLIDASVAEQRQNKALKDLIHNAIWSETWEPLVKWMYDQEKKKGRVFPFYHEPQGLDG